MLFLSPTVRDLGLAASLFIEISMTTFETKTGTAVACLKEAVISFRASERTAESCRSVHTVSLSNFNPPGCGIIDGTEGPKQVTVAVPMHRVHQVHAQAEFR